MKKASLIVHPTYQNNKLFDLSDKTINRDNCMSPFYLLKQKFANAGYDLSTQDINPLETSEIVIYNEMPSVLPSDSKIAKSYLILFESELIRPDNWDLDKHRYFHMIFTWHNEFVDNKKYFKINFAQEIPQTINKDLSKKEKLCTMIAGNKSVSHPLELYSKRVEAIRWFEKHHTEDFDLYGMGWDSYRFNGPKIIRALNRIKALTRFLAPSFPSYKGKVERKKEVLEKYKFAICYENARDIPGYITEKIFDSLFAGCVPIYWGANNVTDYIPKECFIDKRDFESYEELYVFIHNMSDDDYLAYLKAIEEFLNSDKIYPFSSEFFAETIIKTIVNDTKNK